MKAPIFPVFALKTVNNQVVIGGGGGNEHFGKKNGLVVLDETTYVDLDYLETEDIILEISVYEPGVNELKLKEDELNWEPHRITEESSDEDLYKSETDLSLSFLKKEDESVVSSTSSVANSLQEVYLSCRGTNSLYLVKLASSKFTLLKRIEKTISCQIFVNSLFVVIEKEIYALLNVVDNPKILEKLCKRKKRPDPSLRGVDHEEYMYYLYKKKGKLLVQRGEGRTEIPEKWENFFIQGTKIHKVLKEEGLYTFVFNGDRHCYEKEIGDIYCNKDTLIFYLKGIDSQLIFLEKEPTVYIIPKITCMNVEGDFTSIGTGDGFGYLFKGHMKISSRKLCDFAITGISYRHGMFYYSSYNGLVDRKHVVGWMKLILQLSVFVLILIAILLGLYLKR